MGTAIKCFKAHECSIAARFEDNKIIDRYDEPFRSDGDFFKLASEARAPKI
jgi:hypothetical protein